MPNDGNETFDMEHLLELAEEKKYRLLKEELVELNEVDIAAEGAGDRGICRASGGQAEPHHQQHHR